MKTKISVGIVSRFDAQKVFSAISAAATVAFTVPAAASFTFLLIFALGKVILYDFFDNFCRGKSTFTVLGGEKLLFPLLKLK